MSEIPSTGEVVQLGDLRRERAREVPLLPSKLYRPRRRAGFVSRERLLARLSEGLELGSLTLITAPAGSGKSSLLADWLEGSGRPVAWLSLDESDNDITLFARYFVKALRNALGESFSPDADVYLNGSDMLDIRSFARDALILPLTSREVIIVLDDVHRIEEPRLHGMLQFFAEQAPRGVHLVLVSRVELPLTLARMRVAGRVVEVDHADLKFTHDEIGRFFKESARLDVHESALAVIEQRTEGWAAALQMSALSMRGTDPDVWAERLSIGDTMVQDYLIEEVLDNVDPDIKEFLLATAILDRMTGDIAQAVSGRADAKKVIERLDAENLFIVGLDAARHWFRYHHLFAELLRKQLDGFPASHVQELHRRAALAFAEVNLGHDAMHHALRSGDTDLMVELFARWAEGLIIRSEIRTVRSWAEALPPEVLQHQPFVATLYAWSLVLGDSPDRAFEIADDVERLIEAGEGAKFDAYDEAKACGNVYALKAFSTARRFALEESLRYSDLATEAFGPDAPLNAVVHLNVAYVASFLGAWDKIENASLQAQRIGIAYENFFAALAGMACRAQLYRRLGRIDESIAVCLEAERIAGQTGLTRHGCMAYVRIEHALCMLESGDVAGAQNQIDEAAMRSELLGDNVLATMILLARAEIVLALEEVESARSLVDQALARVPTQSRGVRYLCDAVTVQIAKRQGDINAILPLARAVPETAGLEALEFFVALNDFPGGSDEFATVQSHWLQRVTPMLAELGGQSILEKFAEAPRSAPVVVTSPPRAKMVDPLSERELEVLALVAAGLSNKEVAGRLFVTEGTVKTHIHNILSKMAVKNRTQAVHHARSLGLLAES
ncbi:MAG: LuxR C-terminal-related transcriptional regulator [bacterium]